ncbi:S-layer homology domain-containing protein [Desulfitibacter alkalitolerans]|uniref:S-layer homology domain-containing protein n=1 Tax=Desulfitibacter alkalitolerans TaxID=264641 RepID=UPI00048A1788|nr:S-layer homology domain-containing protein [Desulfitibacter alkalitolerans]
MKRSLVVVLTIAILLFAFAGLAVAESRFPDVSGSLANPVERLANLEILQGYPDGTFRPDGSITRAEFAAVAVRALGLDIAAEASKGMTKFSDVSASHWASGFINVATQQGIIVGYPDGTFKPEANVTHAEALAMIVRLLGYENTLVGAWPTNYLVKAAQLGLTRNVSIVANSPATRGQVAIFTNNALDTPMWELSETDRDGRQVFREGGTLLERSLRVIKVTEVEVTGVPYADDSLKANEARFAGDGLATSKFVVRAAGVNANDLVVGASYDVWVRDDNRDGTLQASENTILAIESRSTIVTGFVKEVKDGRIELKDGTRHLLKTRTASAGTNLYFNNSDTAVVVTTSVADNDLDAHFTGTANVGLKNAYIQMIKDTNNRIEVAYVYQNTGYGNVNTSVIVSSMNYSKPEISFNRPGTDVVTRLNLEDKKAYVKLDGKWVDLEKIEKGHVLNIYQNGDAYLIFASSETVEGNLVRSQSGGIGPSPGMGTLVLDKNVPVAHRAGYSKEGGSPSTAANFADFADFAGNNVKVWLNFFGQAVFVDGKRDVSTTDVIAGHWRNVGGFGNEREVRVFTLAGDVVTYKSKNNDAVTKIGALGIPEAPATSTNPPSKRILDLALDSDGKFTAETALQTSRVTNDANFTVIDKDNNRVTLGDTSRRVTADTKFIDARSWDITDWEVYSWTEFRNSTYSGSGTANFKLTSTGVVDYVVITAWAGLNIQASDVQYGIKTANSKAGTKDYITVKVSGQTATYELDSGTIPSNNVPIEFTISSSDKITIRDASARTVTGYVYTIDRNALQLVYTSDIEGEGAQVIVALHEDVQVYKDSDVKDLYDINARDEFENQAGTRVTLLWDTDNLVRVIRIH